MMPTRNTSSEKKRMKLRDAAVYLGVSQAKITRLIRLGILPYTVDELDLRQKLVLVEDLDRIKNRFLALKGKD
jgi:predicted XRE-type DNA-binding protein